MTDIEVTLNAWEFNSASALAVQGESCGRTIKATFIDRKGLTDGSFNAASVDRPIDLTNATLKLYCIKPDSTTTLSDGTVTDAVNGKASFVLPYQATAKDGEVVCQIVIFWPDNSTVKVIGLNLNVKPSDLDGAVQSISEWPALIEALNEVKTSDAIAKQAAADSQVADEKANDAVTAAEKAKETSDGAAQKAIDAANTAEQAAQDALNSHSMISPVTHYSEPIEKVINDLFATMSALGGGTPTAAEYAALGLTAEQYAAKGINAAQYAMAGKSLLGG